LPGSCPPASFNILKVANIVLAADRFEGANFSNSLSIVYVLSCRFKMSANGFGLGEGGDFHHKC
jgi:hypothetical protein